MCKIIFRITSPAVFLTVVHMNMHERFNLANNPKQTEKQSGTLRMSNYWVV